MPPTGDQLVGEGAGELYGGDEPLFSFTVPDELLQEAISKSRHKEAVADVALMPGVGEGRPPPLLADPAGQRLRPARAASPWPPSSRTCSGQGINLIGNNLEKSFHLHDAGLGAVAFVASVAQLAVGRAARRCGPTGAAARSWPAVALLVFAVLGPLMALAPNVWWFVMHLPVRLGRAVP